MNQTQLSDLIGVSFKEMDKILVENGLKINWLATHKAIDDDYIYVTAMEDRQTLYYWNLSKILELTRKKREDEIGFWVNHVLCGLDQAYEFFFCEDNSELALLRAAQAYKDVPKEFCDKVNVEVEKTLFGGQREVCGKCGRTSPTSAMIHAKSAKQVMSEDEYKALYRCWRCIPEDPFMQAKLDLEAKVRQEASSACLRILYENYELIPNNNDAKLLAGTIGDAIDFSIGYCIDPTQCIIGDEFIEARMDIQSILEFRYSGFEEFDYDRCKAFLEVAYNTIAETLMQRGITIEEHL